ncbi:hypothetical protein DITRI_Ditri03aG0038200 [Diplodiscus trichospermus]
MPINGLHEWKKSELEPILAPFVRNMPGKPKTNRRKSKDEPKKKAKSRKMSKGTSHDTGYKPRTTSAQGSTKNNEKGKANFTTSTNMVEKGKQKVSQAS